MGLFDPGYILRIEKDAEKGWTWVLHESPIRIERDYGFWKFSSALKSAKAFAGIHKLKIKSVHCPSDRTDMVSPEGETYEQHIEKCNAKRGGVDEGT